MFDDREIRYIAGEMDDAEMRAYESALDAESASLKRDLQSAFASLPKLRDDVPECQFSTEHLWNAIDAAPKAKAPIFNFKQWWVVAPIAASLLVMALMYKPSGSSEPARVTNESDLLAMNSEVNPKATDEVGTFSSGSITTTTVPSQEIPTAVQKDNTSAAIANVTIDPQVADSVKPKIKPKKKKRTNRLQIPASGWRVADNRFDRLPGGLSVGSVTMKRSPDPLTMTEADQPVGTLDAAMSAPAGRGVSSTALAPRTESRSEPIVIVSASANMESGTQTAVEVRQNDNIVIGG